MIRPEAELDLLPTGERTQPSWKTWLWAGVLTAAATRTLSWVACLLAPVLDLMSIAIWVLLVLLTGGLVQWLFLRQRVPDLENKLGPWMLVTAPLGTVVIAAVVGPGSVILLLLISFGLPGGTRLSLLQETMAPAVVMGLGAACGGILTAVLQALFLRRTVSRAGWWIPAKATGWMLGAAGGVLLCNPVLSILPP
jgi:hypothetical protein